MQSQPPIQLVLAELKDIKHQMSELKAIKQQMSKLDRIDQSTCSLSDQLTGVMDRTSELKTAVVNNSAQLREYVDPFGTIKAKVGKCEVIC